MRQLKKIMGLLVFSLVLSTLLVGCGKSTGNEEGVASEQVEATVATPVETKEETVEVEATEDEKEEVEVEVPVVVSGTVSVTRILAGLEVALVGIPTTDKVLPDAVLGATPIGLPMTPDIEIVKSLDSDYFITDKTLEERLAESLKAQEINTLFINTSGYQNILDAITELGNKFDRKTQAEAMIAEIVKHEAAAMTVAEGKEPLTVAILFGSPENFMMATSSSFVGDLVTRLGSTNVADSLEGARAPYIPLSLEYLAEANPDVILRLTHANPEQAKMMFDQAFADNAFYAGLKAVKEERVIDLDPDYFGVVATIDCGESLYKLAEILYGK